MSAEEMTQSKEWTENEDKAIEYGWRNGMSFEKIAGMMNRSPDSVHERFTGHITKQRGFRSPTKIPWTKVLDNQLRKMYESGLSVEEIAKKMGRTYGAIKIRLEGLFPVTNHLEEARSNLNKAIELLFKVESSLICTDLSYLSEDALIAVSSLKARLDKLPNS